MRYSKQRECILNFLNGNKSHPTAYEVYNAVREEMPNISLGTVYRNLNTLTDEKIISSIETTENIKRYDYNTENHFHIRCRKCKKVFDIFSKPDKNFKEAFEKRENIKIEDYNIIFNGICTQCKK